jgi:hypothetical protein
MWFETGQRPAPNIVNVIVVTHCYALDGCDSGLAAAAATQMTTTQKSALLTFLMWIDEAAQIGGVGGTILLQCTSTGKSCVRFTAAIIYRNVRQARLSHNGKGTLYGIHLAWPEDHGEANGGASSTMFWRYSRHLMAWTT